MTRSVRRTLGLASTAFILLSCGTKPRITGLVVDIRQQPLPAAMVQISGTTLSAETDSGGRYSLPYVPRQFTVSYSKPGFTSFSRPQNIAVEAEVPAATVRLIKLPPARGIFYVAPKEYIKLAAVDVHSQEKRHSFSWFGTTAEYLYTPVSPGKWTEILAPLVPLEQKILFLDNNGLNDALLMLAPDDSLWKRSARGVGVEYEDAFQGANAAVEEIHDGLFLWSIHTLPGRYAFVVRNADNALTHPVASPAHPFRVQIDLPPAQAAGILGTWNGNISRDAEAGAIEVHLALDRDGSTESGISFLGGTDTFGTTKYALWHTEITPDTAAFTIPFGWHHDGTLITCKLQKQENRLQGPCDHVGPKKGTWNIRLDQHRTL